MSMAESALAGRGWIPSYPTNFIPPPGQAFFLYAARALWPTGDYQHLRTVQALVSIATIAIFAGIALELAGAWAAVLAAWALALSFPHASIVGILVPETNYVFALTASVWCLVRTLRRPSAFGGLAAGAVLGLACLFKPTPMLFVFPAAALAWFAAPRSARARHAGLLVLGYCLLVGPWIGRNYRHYGEVYPISTNGGFLLALANFEGLDAAREDMRYWDDLYRNPVWIDPEIEARFAGVRDRDGKLEDNLKDRAYYRKAAGYILTHPGHFLRNYTIKVVNFVRFPEAEASAAPLPFREIAWWLPLLTAVGIAGAVAAIPLAPGDRGAWALPAMLVYLLAFGALYHITRDGRMNLAFRALCELSAGCLVGTCIARTTRPRDPMVALNRGPGPA